MLAVPPGLWGQSRQVFHEDQEGARFLNQIRLSERWSLIQDVGYRWQTGFRESNLYMLRTAASYTTASDIDLGVAMSYMGYYLTGSVRSGEYRPSQEISKGHRLWGLNLNHRLRLEERWLRTRRDGTQDAQTAFYFRPRYALQLRLLLFRLSQVHPDRRLVLTLGDEVLCQAGGGDAFGFTVRNRFLVSPSLEFSRRFGVSLSFTQQTTPTATPGVFRSSEVLWLMVKHRVDAFHTPSAAHEL